MRHEAPMTLFVTDDSELLAGDIKLRPLTRAEITYNVYKLFYVDVITCPYIKSNGLLVKQAPANYLHWLTHCNLVIWPSGGIGRHR